MAYLDLFVFCSTCWEPATRLLKDQLLLGIIVRRRLPVSAVFPRLHPVLRRAVSPHSIAKTHGVHIRREIHGYEKVVIHKVFLPEISSDPGELRLYTHSEKARLSL